LRSFNF
jgi:Leucine-rich repeat (LRR) protein